jgi:large subunit ribosomal protein L25
MDKQELAVKKRVVQGKKVSVLRRAGTVPGNIFGHGIESIAVEVDRAKLEKVLSKVGTSRLVSLTIEGDATPRNIIIKSCQRDYRGERIIHADFYQVNMSERVRVVVPIKLTGEAPALAAKLGTLMQSMRSLRLECLPGEIPPHIDVDLSPLDALDAAIHVKDVKAKDGIIILTPGEELIVKVGQVKIVKEEAPKAAEAAEGVVAEGAAAAEGEAPKAEGVEGAASEKGKAAAPAGGKAAAPAGGKSAGGKATPAAK